MPPALASEQSPVERVSEWLFKRALPHYSRWAVAPNGLAYEEFDFQGAPKETGSRRTMVQFRQTYVLAHAALLGASEAAIASELFVRVTRNAWHPDGGWAHRLDPNGRVLDATRDAYDQAFALLACAWIYELTGEPEALRWAQRSLLFLDTHMASHAGGYLESLPVRLPRRQNPHMHLFEALLALFAVSGDELYLERAQALRSLVEHHFVSTQGGLREFFGEDFEMLPGVEGQIVEPGHHFEWVWLLHEHARLTSVSPDPLALGLFDFAAKFGLGPSGLPIEEIDVAGAPRQTSVKLWAATEQLKAQIARAEHSHSSEGFGVERTVSSIFEWCLGAPSDAPVWYERVDASMRPDMARMPASTLYHLVLGFSEYLRWQGKIPRVLGRARAA